MLKTYIVLIVSMAMSGNYYGQGCCSGGSASPLAGGTSQGVLNEHQLEIAPNFQYSYSNKFLAKDHDTTPMLNSLSSDYLYLRLAYGVTPKLTMSIESGYYFKREQVGLHQGDSIKTNGIADLILFPRFEVYKKCTEKRNTEVVIGMGYKIPIGNHDDTTVFYTDPISGTNYYQVAPPTVQPTNGSNDFIFYGFFFNKYNLKNFRLFANTIYVRKGWNSLGQKYGDYASIGLFASTTVLKRVGITFQLKGELIGKMQADKNVDMIAYYNIYPESTGSRKVFIAPQISYNYKAFSVYALSEIPIYQYVNGSQIASQFQLTAGISYKLNTKKECLKN